MKKTFVIWETIDGHKYLNGVIECTEEEVKKYCQGKTAEEELDAYSMDEDDPFYDPFPYVSSFSYEEVEKLELPKAA